MQAVKGDDVHVMQEGGQIAKPLSQALAGRDFRNLRAMEKLRGHGKDDGRDSFRNNRPFAIIDKIPFYLTNDSPAMRPSSSTALLELNPKLP